MTRNEKAAGQTAACKSKSFLSASDNAHLKLYRNSPSTANNSHLPKVGIAEIASRYEAAIGKRIIVKNGSFRVPCIVHGGKGHNLVVWVNSDGTIGMKCYSHGCDRKDIIETLGFTLADILPGKTPTEISQRKAFRTRVQIESELLQELLLLWKMLSKRNCDRILQHDKGIREENPQWIPMSKEPWEREVLAAKCVMAGLGVYYGK